MESSFFFFPQNCTANLSRYSQPINCQNRFESRFVLSLASNLVFPGCFSENVENNFHYPSASPPPTPPLQMELKFTDFYIFPPPFQFFSFFYLLIAASTQINYLLLSDNSLFWLIYDKSEKYMMFTPMHVNDDTFIKPFWILSSFGALGLTKLTKLLLFLPLLLFCYFLS